VASQATLLALRRGLQLSAAECTNGVELEQAQPNRCGNQSARVEVPLPWRSLSIDHVSERSPRFSTSLVGSNRLSLAHWLRADVSLRRLLGGAAHGFEQDRGE